MSAVSRRGFVLFERLVVIAILAAPIAWEANVPQVTIWPVDVLERVLASEIPYVGTRTSTLRLCRPVGC